MGGGAPQVFSLAGLEEDLKRAYRSVTEGKFGDALGRFTAILHTIPLLVVPTRKQVDDVKELLAIAKCAPPQRAQPCDDSCNCRLGWGIVIVISSTNAHERHEAPSGYSRGNSSAFPWSQYERFGPTWRTISTFHPRACALSQLRDHTRLCRYVALCTGS